MYQLNGPDFHSHLRQTWIRAELKANVSIYDFLKLFLYEVLKVVKIRMEKRTLVPKVWWRRGKLLFNGYRVSVLQDEKELKTCCTTKYRHVTLPNCTINIYSSTFFTLVATVLFPCLCVCGACCTLGKHSVNKFLSQSQHYIFVTKNFQIFFQVIHGK